MLHTGTIGLLLPLLILLDELIFAGVVLDAETDEGTDLPYAFNFITRDCGASSCVPNTHASRLRITAVPVEVLVAMTPLRPVAGPCFFQN